MVTYSTVNYVQNIVYWKSYWAITLNANFMTVTYLNYAYFNVKMQKFHHLTFCCTLSFGHVSDVAGYYVDDGLVYPRSHINIYICMPIYLCTGMFLCFQGASYFQSLRVHVTRHTTWYMQFAVDLFCFLRLDRIYVTMERAQIEVRVTSLPENEYTYMSTHI